MCFFADNVRREDFIFLGDAIGMVSVLRFMRRTSLEAGGVMYKLLLVSDKEEIRSLYRHYAEWNTLGFEQPDYRGKRAAGHRSAWPQSL